MELHPHPLSGLFLFSLFLALPASLSAQDLELPASETTRLDRFTLASASSPDLLSDAQPTPSIWPAKPGDGFCAGTKEFGFGIGAGFGMTVITSRGTHDWVLSTLEYGWVFTDVVGADHWYRGNWEFLVQVFGGSQFYPDTSYVIGGGPLIRYNFATGHRLVPFIDLGGGAAATDIRNGDLSTTFEFNLQGGLGAHWFIRDNVALTFQYRFIHLSNAGIKFPNLGVNTSTFLIGASWFF